MVKMITPIALKTALDAYKQETFLRNRNMKRKERQHERKTLHSEDKGQRLDIIA